MRIEHSSGTQVWTVVSGVNALTMRMERGQLQCEHFGAVADADRSFDGPTPSWPDHGQQIFRGRRDAAVLLRGDVSPVTWSVDSWRGVDNVFDMRLLAADVPLEAMIRMTFSENGACLDRQTTLRHAGDAASDPLDIASASSFSVAVPHASQLTTTSGWWVAETQISHADARTPILLESRSGKTGFEHAPYLAIEGAGRTTVVQLGWSGNWMIHAAPMWDSRVHVSGGLNSFGLRHRLRPGQTLRLPSVQIVSVEGDLNHATQALHRLRRSRRLARRQPIPVHFNTWYPHPGEAHVSELLELVPGAAELGCENFVLDAGWYTTTQPPTGTHWLKWAGDWRTNPLLYPNGLVELSDGAHDHGMDFGLWFEPEAAGPESDLVTQHPEWMHHVPAFAWGPDDLRVVNFGIPAARATVFEAVVAHLRATNATWMKWDFNANLWEGGWHPNLGAQDADPLVAHYEGLYQFQAELLEAVPGLVLEMCSSGGGRFDAEIMRRAHSGWASDQWQPLQNLSIHFGSHYLHPPEEITDWLIEWPPRPDEDEFNIRTDLRFRVHVAMLSSFGVSAPLQKWSTDDFALVGVEIARYKSFVRDLLPVSNQYMLTEQPPLGGAGDWAAMWFVAQDRSSGSLSTFRLEGAPHRAFALPGLEPAVMYEVSTSGGPVGRFAGTQLAESFAVELDTPYRSQMFHVQRVAAR